jgi:tryptophanase
MEFRTIIEPFRIKSVEPIAVPKAEERSANLREAHFNPFLLKSSQVIIDLLTDSGTSAMSSHQWAAMMRGDESYAGADSWLRLESEIQSLTGYPYILPTHQGRAAERILYGLLAKPGKHFYANSFFDTTRANIEYAGGIATDCPCLEAAELQSDFPFKGNIDLHALELHVRQVGKQNVPVVCLTLTNNSGGGQPVSLANVREVSHFCRREGILFLLDVCRIAENCYFIKHREPGHEHKTYREIAQEIFSLADGCIMSAKKDGLANMGGFLALKHRDLVDACNQMLIITEGYVTYGGLSGRDMEAIAVGLREVFDEDYLHYRIRSTQYLGDKLNAMGVPVMLPVGGHAVYVDAAAFYPHISLEEYPGQALVCDLYEKGGIRCVEVGSVMFGKYDHEGRLLPASRELVRLAIPRRVYTQSHIDFVVEVFEKVWRERHQTRGLRIVWEPKFLRHFTAQFVRV